MSPSNNELKILIEGRPEISALTRYINGKLLLEGFTNEEVLVIAAYLWEFFEKENLGEYSYEAMEFQDLYRYLGGDLSEYDEVCFSAKRQGWIGLSESGIDKIAYLSASKGIDVLERLLGRESDHEIRVIRAGKPYVAKSKFKQFLETYMIPAERLLLADSYLEPTTLEFLLPLFEKIKSIHILTKQINGDEQKFLQDLEKFRKDGKFHLELRKNSKIHDRYLINETNSWTIGGSIHQLGGKSDVILSDVTIIVESVKQLFKDRWKEARLIWEG